MNFLLFIALTGLAVLATPTPKPAAEPKIQAAAAARLARRSADTDWSATCSIDNADGDVLTATCENGSGGTNVSSINLNDCLTNENGVLVYPGNDFAASCFNFSWSGTVFSATCPDFAGNDLNDSFDTNDFINNTNGVLTC